MTDPEWEPTDDMLIRAERAYEMAMDEDPVTVSLFIVAFLKATHREGLL